MRFTSSPHSDLLSGHTSACSPLLTFDPDTLHSDLLSRHRPSSSHTSAFSPDPRPGYASRLPLSLSSHRLFKPHFRLLATSGHFLLPVTSRFRTCRPRPLTSCQSVCHQSLSASPQPLEIARACKLRGMSRPGFRLTRCCRPPPSPAG